MSLQLCQIQHTHISTFCTDAETIRTSAQVGFKSHSGSFYLTIFPSNIYILIDSIIHYQVQSEEQLQTMLKCETCLVKRVKYSSGMYMKRLFGIDMIRYLQFGSEAFKSSVFIHNYSRLGIQESKYDENVGFLIYSRHFKKWALIFRNSRHFKQSIVILFDLMPLCTNTFQLMKNLLKIAVFL